MFFFFHAAGLDFLYYVTIHWSANGPNTAIFIRVKKKSHIPSSAPLFLPVPIQCKRGSLKSDLSQNCLFCEGLSAKVILT